MCTTSAEPLPDPKSVIKGTDMPEWVSAAGRQLYDQAAEMAASPYPAFTGPRVATYGDALDEAGNPIQVGINPDGSPIFQQERLTADERAAADILRGGTDIYQGYIDDAKAMTDTLGQGYDAATREELLGADFSLDTAQPYLDIYQSAVDPAIREIERQTRQNLIEDSAAAARAGAFGGSRQGLREATSIAEGAQLAGDARAQAAARGLEFAGQRFDQDRAARFTAEDAMRAGFETDEASRLRAADADYVEQREYPFQMLNFALGALQGVPYETRTIGLEQGTQYVQSPSVYGQTIGGLGSLASAYYLGNR